MTTISPFVQLVSLETVPPKKGKGSHSWQANYASDVGLLMTSREEVGGAVDSAVCRFYECWDYRDANDVAEDSGWKRESITNKNRWSGVFRRGNTHVHMTQQHSTKFFVYETLKNRSGITSAKLHEYFKWSVIGAFVEKHSTNIGPMRIFTIDKTTLEKIVQNFMLSTARENDTNLSEDPDKLPSGDRDMNIYVLQYAVADDGFKAVSFYTVTIQNPV